MRPRSGLGVSYTGGVVLGWGSGVGEESFFKTGRPDVVLNTLRDLQFGRWASAP